MSKVIVGMTTSIDHGTAYMNALIAETGAVLMGGGRSPHVKPKQDEHLTFTFVTEGVESAVAQATAAARDGAVQVVGGISVIQQVLRAGLADELHIDVMPVLLGSGRRLFEKAGLEQIDLEKVQVLETGARTSLRFHVKKK